MIVRRCDVCGKVTLDLDRYQIVIVTAQDGQPVAPQVELCDPCTAKLKKWLKLPV